MCALERRGRVRRHTGSPRYGGPAVNTSKLTLEAKDTQMTPGQESLPLYLHGYSAFICCNLLPWHGCQRVFRTSCERDRHFLLGGAWQMESLCHLLPWLVLFVYWTNTRSSISFWSLLCFGRVGAVDILDIGWSSPLPSLGNVDLSVTQICWVSYHPSLVPTASSLWTPSTHHHQLCNRNENFQQPSNPLQ